jgi:hypothetical protein
MILDELARVALQVWPIGQQHRLIAFKISKSIFLKAEAVPSDFSLLYPAFRPITGQLVSRVHGQWTLSQIRTKRPLLPAMSYSSTVSNGHVPNLDAARPAPSAPQGASCRAIAS